MKSCYELRGIVRLVMMAVLLLTGGERVGEAADHGMTAATYLLMFGFYLVQYFVIIFFQTALTGVALQGSAGGPSAQGVRITANAFSQIGHRRRIATAQTR